MFCPLYSISPDVGVTKPRTRLASVVFPLPLSPAMVVMRGCWPSRTSENWSSATSRPRSRRPPPNILETLRTSSNGVCMHPTPLHLHSVHQDLGEGAEDMSLCFHCARCAVCYPVWSLYRWQATK